MSRIPINEIVGVAVLELVRRAGGRIDKVKLGNGTSFIEAAMVPDVYYMPSALAAGQSVQIVGRHQMPLEAVFDDFTPRYVRQELLKRSLTELPDAEETIDGTVCILGNVFSRNFCHWHEEMMKAIVLERIGYECNYVIAELPAFAKELLGLIGIAPERILEVRQPTRFRTALFTTPVSYRNLAEYPGVLHGLREKLLAADRGGRPEVGPRLWLDRGKQTRLGRKLVNEEEVCKMLDRYSFERVDMGSLSVTSQIAISRNARVISGLHGAQFVHSQLMNPRSWVIECFSPKYLNPTYTEIYRVLQHSYAQITSMNTPLFPYPHGSDVLVDCQQLDLALRAATENLTHA
ncbi:MAG: glycosyltransferase family 61 protein [Verrucomicrobiota bacterium]|nr:glycosyltransferase family 61 protein [Verrucomicrobiota bacterium]